MEGSYSVETSSCPHTNGSVSMLSVFGFERISKGSICSLPTEHGYSSTSRTAKGRPITPCNSIPRRPLLVLQALNRL
jgi:hypothetical protein